MMETRTWRAATGSEIPLVVSSVMPAGFRHGFTTRAGGVSVAPFAALNLGGKWGDDEASVAENHRRLLSISGARVMLRVSQVHGTRVLRVRCDDVPDALAATQADGLTTGEAGLGLSVHVADCTPILMACPTTGACAALHAGWRGTVGGIAGAGVRALAEHFGCRPHDLRVALGPCIGPCCFEVGPEVAAAFRAALPSSQASDVIVAVPGRQPHVDLRRFQRLQLEAAGLLAENIDASTDCTFCDPAGRFFSFRRSGRATGQLVGFVLRVG